MMTTTMTNQQRAAMQMALKALELALDWAPDSLITGDALTALHEVLAQPQDHSEQHLNMVQGEPVAYPDVVLRVLRFAGKTRRQVSNPCLTANDCIELANWMVANHRANENCECTYCLNHFTPPSVEAVAGSDDDTDKAAELGWHLQAQIEAAIEATKEKAAKVCENLPSDSRKEPYDCAAAIRSMK